MTSRAERAENIAENLLQKGGPANQEAAGKIFAILALVDALTDQHSDPDLVE